MTSGRRRAWLAALLAPVIITPVCWSLYRKTGAQAATVCGGILILLVVTSAVTDVCRHKIYNWATYPAFVWAIGINTYASIRYAEPLAAPASPPAVSGERTFSARDEPPTHFTRLGAVGISDCLLGATACFTLMLIIYSLSGRGAGDVKLATVIGALLGFRQGLAALCLTYLFAGIAAISWTVWTEGPLCVLKKTVGWLLGWSHPRLAMWAFGDSGNSEVSRRPMPLGLFYALGTLSVLFELIPVSS